MKHITKIMAQTPGETTEQPAKSTATGETKPEIRNAPSMGGGCIPVGSR